VILISLVGFLISILFYNYFARRFISDPINKMMQVMKDAETGNLEARFIPNSITEINSMGVSLNDMIQQLNNHINTEYKLVLQQKNAEYRALQSQIQPHFIYNVLNGFFALNRLGKREVLEKSIMDLTGMLRYTLSIDEKTTIREELSFIEKYCALQKLRFEERLRYEISTEEGLEECSIPRLLVQPLVENAVKHGVEPLIRRCSVQIIVNKLIIDGNNFLRILVRDDGAGFDKNRNHKESIGILNIKERLSLISAKSRFSISSSPGEGTDVSILIPMECV
jgi:two-component system sensor histidine kinase YesM